MRSLTKISKTSSSSVDELSKDSIPRRSAGFPSLEVIEAGLLQNRASMEIRQDPRLYDVLLRQQLYHRL